MAPIAASEDFAVMLEHCPGSYLFIGNGDGEGGAWCITLGTTSTMTAWGRGLVTGFG